MINYENKVALVTGAASGIGAALTQALANRGAQLICADRDGDGAARTADAIGNSARALVCDLADPATGTAIIDQVYEMTRSFWHDEVQAHLQTGHPLGTQLSWERALDDVQAPPLHEGAKRFYVKKGMIS